MQSDKVLAFVAARVRHASACRVVKLIQLLSEMLPRIIES